MYLFVWYICKGAMFYPWLYIYKVQFFRVQVFINGKRYRNSIGHWVTRITNNKEVKLKLINKGNFNDSSWIHSKFRNHRIELIKRVLTWHTLTFSAKFRAFETSFSVGAFLIFAISGTKDFQELPRDRLVFCNDCS